LGSASVSRAGDGVLAIANVSSVSDQVQIYLKKRSFSARRENQHARRMRYPTYLRAALKFRSSANECTVAQREAPRMMRRARDTDSRVRHNIDSHICVANKAVPPVGAQIHFVVSTCNSERLREFAWP